MRLFIGLMPNPALRREAAAYASFFSSEMPGKYADADNYHVTLAFLGEIAEDALPDVERCMRETAARVKPFSDSILGADAFGKPERRILHLTVRGAERMGSASDILRERLEARGLPFDPKPFRAHITLARGVRFLPQPLPFPPAAVSCANGLTLFHSARVADALRYTPIRFCAFSSSADSRPAFSAG